MNIKNDRSEAADFLKKKIQRLESEISSLTNEKRISEKILSEVVSGKLDSKGINPTEKRIETSVLRSYIIDYLVFRGKKPTKVCDIYDYVSNKYKEINKNTFRTHLMKMSSEEMIERCNKKGYWRSAKQLPSH